MLKTLGFASIGRRVSWGWSEACVSGVTGGFCLLIKSLGYTALPKLVLYIHFKRCKLYPGFFFFF